MLFNTAAFGVLLMLVVTLAWALRAAGLPWPVERRARIGLLLVASYWFYACWDRRFVLLIGGVTLVDWLAALALERLRDARSRLWLLAATVGLNLGLLGLWKYTDFFGDSFAAAMALLGSPSHFEPLGLLLPVGISFFIFQGLSYVIDVYRRDITAERSLPRFALFISFFPQLVAGPIVRAKQLLPQLDRPLVLDTPRFGRALALILGGLLKKVVVADYLAANLVDRVFDLPTHYGSIEVLCGVYGYALQIYGDFSGYCDIAIGVALLLGIELPLNFDLPYRADGLRDFWRRWHITLSRWLRDYLYISMGGSRGSRHATYRNLAITMLLGGLWHGASYNFVIWGGLHGAALVAGRMWSQRRAQRAGARAAPLPSEPVATVLPRWARVALTFMWFARCGSFSGLTP